MDPRCDRCDLPARHSLVVDGGQIADVCCVHADEVMSVARDLVPAAEGAEGWNRWVADHQEMCHTEGET